MPIFAAKHHPLRRPELEVNPLTSIPRSHGRIALVPAQVAGIPGGPRYRRVGYLWGSQCSWKVARYHKVSWPPSSLHEFQAVEVAAGTCTPWWAPDP